MELKGSIYAVGYLKDIQTGVQSVGVFPVSYNVVEDDTTVTFTDEVGNSEERYFEDYDVESVEELNFSKLNEMLDDLGDLGYDYEILDVFETFDEAKEEAKRYIDKYFRK